MRSDPFDGKETVHDSHRKHDFHHRWWFGDRTWPRGGAAQTREPGHHFRSPEIASGSNEEGESRNSLGRAGPSRPEEHRLGSKEAHRPVSEAQRPDQQRGYHDVELRILGDELLCYRGD